MKSKLIITAMGDDRAGLVSQLSEWIIEHQGNIDDSRMASLAGQFAIILQVSGALEDLQQLDRDLSEKMPQIGLEYISRISREQVTDRQAIPYRIQILSMDNPGIVNQISQYLSRSNINILSMQTDSYPAPHTGTQMFSMTITISLAGDNRIADVKEGLNEICDNLNLDMSIEGVKR